MMDKRVRAVDWISRLLVAAANCGWSSAVRMLFLSRFGESERSVDLRGFGATITFRGRRDYGVLTHFFIPSFRIVSDSRDPAWIIDAGANIGDETIKFARFHPRARIISIEADPANVGLLDRNTAPLAAVSVEPRALWSVAGERLSLQRGLSPESTSTVPGSGNSGEKVETTSIPALREKYGINRIDILKLDIEGAELHLLAENTEWLESVDVIIMEVADHENPGGLQRLCRVFPGELDCHLVGENVVAIRRGSGYDVERYRLLRELRD